jgi:hypothetical protein
MDSADTIRRHNGPSRQFVPELSGHSGNNGNVRQEIAREHLPEPKRIGKNRNIFSHAPFWLLTMS